MDIAQANQISQVHDVFSIISFHSVIKALYEKMERVMGSRPTITDLAAKAGVSIATVDRVLNGRLKVRDETSRRVYEAAKELGFHATSLIRQCIQADMPEIRLGFSWLTGR